MASLCEELERRPTDVLALKAALESLLGFLASDEGRTDGNCRAVDSFVGVANTYGWSGDWEHVPESLRGILSDMGGALHDTIQAPEIAANFASTPEQLLQRVRGVDA